MDRDVTKERMREVQQSRERLGWLRAGQESGDAGKVDAPRTRVEGKPVELSKRTWRGKDETGEIMFLA